MDQLKEQSTVVEETQQVLTFVDENLGEDFSRVEEIPTVVGSSLENRVHSIVDFLERPVEIFKVSWTESMADNTTLGVFPFPSTLMKMEMIHEKLSGFKFFRGSVVVRVVVNSQRFQAGGLIIAALPVESPNPDFNSQVNTSLENMSQLPGGVMNIVETNVFEHESPFVYPNNAFDLVAGPPDYVTVHLRVFSKLNAGDFVTVTVFAWFKDIQLSMPTSDPLKYSSFALEAKMRHLVMRGEVTKKYIESLLAEQQLEGANEEQVAAVGGGPVSSVLSTVGGIGKTLAGMGIPFLSEVAGVGSMVAGAASSVASLFGFSSPDNNTTQMLTLPSLAKGINNSDYPHAHHQMALMSGNKLLIGREVFGTKIDEMSIMSIAKVPSLILSDMWTEAMPEGTLITSFTASPMSNKMIGDTHIDISSLTYVASAFEWWRGSINFVFQFFKTAFHSGRLMAVWFNSDGPIPTTYNSNIAKNFQVLIDLKEDRMEYGINVPFIQPVEFLSVHSDVFRKDNGYIGLYVVNRLRAVGGAATSVNIKTWMYAGNDFEVAVPTTPRIRGFFFMPSTIVSGNLWSVEVSYSSSTSPIVLTSKRGTEIEATFERDTVVRVAPNVLYVLSTFVEFEWIKPMDSYILFSKTSDMAVTFTVYYSHFPIKTKFSITHGRMLLEQQNEISRSDCQSGKDEDSIATGEVVPTFTTRDMTMGEQIKSLRCLMHRNVPIEDYHEVIIGDTTWIVFQALAPQLVSNAFSVNYVDHFMPGFRFQSGGMRYLLTLTTSVPGQNILVYFIPNETVLKRDPRFSCQSQIQFFPVTEGTCKIEVPYYNRNVLAIVGDKENGDLLQQSFHLIVFQKPESTFILQKTAAEDFSLGYYLGAPRMRVTLEV